jgi:hypothetical protein
MFEMFPIRGGERQPSSTALIQNYGALTYPPNELYEYSNIGFEALGRIASNISGLAFDELLTTRVLKPLGLHDSFFDTDKAHLANGALLYDELERPIPQYFTATPPSGELYVSAHDLARFAMFNLKNHLPDQAQIFEDHLIDEIHKPVFSGPNRGATTFGWFSGETKSGLSVIFKDGGQPGVSTIMYMVPEENLACVALSNRSDNGEFLQKLVDEMAGVIIPNWTTPHTSVSLPTVDFPERSAYSGKWSGQLHGGRAEMSVSMEFTSNGNATLLLGNRRPELVTNLGLQGNALVGKSVGTIESADAIRNHATWLSFKLQQRADKLTGRVLANVTVPGDLAILPFVVDLRRSQ